jgi:excisionase family DNA binding protein
MKRKKNATESANQLHLSLLTIKDAAEILGVSRNTLNGMLANGMLSYVEVSKHTRRIPAQVLADFVNRTKKEKTHD